TPPHLLPYTTLFRSPAQRLVDFTNAISSSSLPKCSYLPGVQSVNLKEVLPNFIHQSLAKAFMAFGKKMKSTQGNTSFFTNEAIRSEEHTSELQSREN